MKTMHSDEFFIERTKRLFEEQTGWGDSAEWTNQDFMTLSDKIQDKTNIALSHVTLKRVWGKVKYDSLPNTHTLDTLVQFLGYENWRTFKTQQANSNQAQFTKAFEPAAADNIETVPATIPKKKINGLKALLISTVGITAITIAIFMLVSNKQSTDVFDKDYSFSSKKVVSEGLPNSVIFNYDATKSPYDSVIIQQSWDKKLQAKVSKFEHQHTSIYYYPDYYKAKLIVGGKIVSMHRLLIKSKGWMPAVTQAPVPVYFPKEDAIHDGKMSLSIKKIQEKNVKLQPTTPNVLYANVRDFGEIYSDNFTFETSVKNDYNEGAAICQESKIYILCEGTAIYIPLCSRGCISTLDLLFTNFYASGKNYDLSAFGVDFSSYVKVRIEAANRKAKVFLNDKLVFSIDKDIIKAKIIGIDYSFQGTGSVDYVKLYNNKVNYRDDFSNASDGTITIAK